MSYIKKGYCKHLSKEHVEKIRLANIGKKRSDEFCKKISILKKGKKLTEEHKKKISIANKGKQLQLGRRRSEETCKKISKANLGRKASQETREKMSRSMKGIKKSDNFKRLTSERCRLEKSNFWRGGKSFEKYMVDWNVSLRRSIRERDNYTCQLCKKPQGDEILSVHHIDYNKQNCNPNNLITLCKSCHAKTNFNRDKRIMFFNL